MRLETIGKPNKFMLEFSTHYGLDAESAQVTGIHWGIQSIATNVRAWIQCTQLRDQLGGKTRSRVHRQINRKQSGRANGIFVQRFAGKIETHDGMTCLAKPRRGGGNTEGLPPKLVGGDQNSIHALPV